jgi:hypothetical protein
MKDIELCCPKEHTVYAERHFYIARISRKRNHNFDPILGPLEAASEVYTQTAISSIVCFSVPAKSHASGGLGRSLSSS